MFTYDQAVERALDLRRRYHHRTVELWYDDETAKGKTEREIHNAPIWYVRVYDAKTGEFLYDVGRED
jgi:hypothetical protein